MKNTLLKVYFLASLIFISYFLGMLTSKFKIFPYQVFDRAYGAFQELKKADKEKDVNPFIFDTVRKGKNVTAYNRTLSSDGNVFMTLLKDGRFGALLVTREGKEIYRWRISYSDVWPHAAHLEYQAPDSRISIHGALLYPNGDVVFNFDDGNFPTGSGLVKINKCSRVVWSLAENTHHSVFRDDDGYIWVTSHVFHRKDDNAFHFIKAPYHEDFVLKLSQDGKVLDRISIVETLYKSGLEGLMRFRNRWVIEKNHEPLHLNNVEVLPRRWSDKFPLFKAGDIMISMRNINTIAVLDKHSKLVKWWLSGLFSNQHDPDFLPNGHILVFDNRWHRRNAGGSRVIEVDPISRKIVWEYSGDAAHPFYTEIRGMEQPLPNGNMLVTESEAGRVFEVTRKGKIVWEYLNALEEEGKVGVVTEADRVPLGYEHFLGQKCN
jgi:Arylsulfotransferase (ASST)